MQSSQGLKVCDLLEKHLAFLRTGFQHHGICTLKVLGAFGKNRPNEGELMRQRDHRRAFPKKKASLSRRRGAQILPAFISPADKDRYSERGRLLGPALYF